MMSVRRDLPSGTVTFLFTDVEGSTRLLHELGTDRYAAALAEHRGMVREAFRVHGGVEVDTQGDAFFVAFPSAREAVAAARDAQEALTARSISVRMGIHTGIPRLTEEGYVGVDVHRAARIGACGHGGQVLVSAATAAQVSGEGLRNLGEHRLKDFEETVSLYQLGEGSFPPLKTISNTNLPRPASSFVGRDKEVAELASLLRDGTRLLTLTGPGGSGKTRLAIEAAAELVPELKAGVFWVGLATLRDPALVTETIAATLGAKHGLAEHIGQRELLLLLDNLEQVVEAAPELAELVEACPSLRLLVTSRELLRVRGELEYSVLPLAEADAMELFCMRSRAGPDETVRELCRALDNLPLALELAAAHVKVLTVEEILGRLDGSLDVLTSRARDAPERQRTLRATIEWSYDLLDEKERTLFARLGVFSGSFDLQTAEDVSEADLETVTSLLDKSLLRQADEGRFFLLETIREFAVERLGATGDSDTWRQRHAQHYLDLAERDANESGERPAVMQRFERDHNNLRAALRWFDQSRQADNHLRLVAALDEFWDVRGHLREGRAHIEAALANSGSQSPALRMEVLAAASDFARIQGDVAQARAYSQESLDLAQRVGEPFGIARALHELGEAAMEDEQFDQAVALFERAVSVAQQAGRSGVGSIVNMGYVALAQGDYERGKALSEQGLALARQEGRDNVDVIALSTSPPPRSISEIVLRLALDSANVFTSRASSGSPRSCSRASRTQRLLQSPTPTTTARLGCLELQTRCGKGSTSLWARANGACTTIRALRLSPHLAIRRLSGSCRRATGWNSSKRLT
jgi:predicted ATPase/class 3 adenylate cyclase